MKKLTYQMPGLDFLDVSVEQGFAASAGWFQDDMGGGSPQIDVVIPPAEDQWG